MKWIMVFLCLSANMLMAQHTLDGKVSGENGQPLYQASVFLKGTSFAAAAGPDGSYSISGIPPGDYELKCSYVGYRDLTTNLSITGDTSLNIALKAASYSLESIEIRANKLDQDSPFSYTEVTEEKLDLQDGAQDLPMLLRYTPAMVVTSDAGAGVGYTGMRIRGSDPTRINVTINGVPLNDAESHSVFWVDLPDFANSVENIQIQRGVGPSTNGAGAFGATIALNSDQLSPQPYVDLRTALGSFDTRRLSLTVNTGLMNNRYQVEGRYSLISSEGYIDRASADLKSWYFSAARVDERASLRLNIFSGEERTYQSWWGTPEAKLEPGLSLEEHYYNNLGVIYQTPADSVNLFGSDRRYNYYTYENQVDDYRQTHYQLIHKIQPTEKLIINSTLHYTRGLGYFEEFRVGDDLFEYGLSPSEHITNLVRRRWLDNHFYGAIINTGYNPVQAWKLTFGGSWSRYLGDHYGQVTDAEDFDIQDPARRYYFNDGIKEDGNIYAKSDIALDDKWSLFGDLQFRSISYNAMGLDNGNATVSIDASYQFFNPKAGVNFRLDDNRLFYFSYAVAHREPVRSDFTDAIGTAVPSEERLDDIEIGMRYDYPNWSLAANAYYMNYRDQLVLTGAINDVGAPVRVNVDDSYRAGVELSGAWTISPSWKWDMNMAFSRNRIESFEEIIVDYGTGDLVLQPFENTPIAFSPSAVISSALTYSPVRMAGITLLSKHVSRQYLDNTGNEARSIDPYFINDLVLSVRPGVPFVSDLELKLMVNNLLDETYSTNGYTYSYIYGDLVTENFYYPQAGRHFLLGLNARF